MKLTTVMPGGICLLISTVLFSQQPDTLIQKLDSLNKRTDTTAQKNIITPKAYTENTGFTFSSYFILLGSDLKQDITAPFHQTRKEWLRIGGFAVATAAVSLLDEPVQRFAVKLHDSSEAISGSSKYITRFGEVYELYTLTAL